MTAGRPTEVDLRQFSPARIGYTAPEEIQVLDEMPTALVVKVDRAALKRLAYVAANRWDLANGARNELWCVGFADRSTIVLSPSRDYTEVAPASFVWEPRYRLLRE